MFCARRCTLEEILTRSDIIMLHSRLTEETRGLIGKKQFEMMKPNTVIVNTSRGEIVDEAALVDALKAGRILGAGLDVFHDEPVPENSPLLGLDNVILTPHIAGHAYEGWFRRSRFAWDNIRRLIAGEPLLSTARPQFAA